MSYLTLTISQVVYGGRQLGEVSVPEGLLGTQPLRRLRLQEHVGEVLGQRDLGQIACMSYALITQNPLSSTIYRALSVHVQEC